MEVHHPSSNNFIHALDHEEDSSLTGETPFHLASSSGKMQGVPIADVPPSPRSVDKGATTPDNLKSTSLEEHVITVDQDETASESSESGVGNDDIWHSVSSVAEELDSPAVSKELLDLARQFSEEKPVSGSMTLDVMKAHQEGAMSEFIKSFEQCRNNAAQAYRAGDQPMAIRWAALAKDAKQSIHYSTQAFKTIMENVANSDADPLITSYASAARAMGERVECRVNILEAHRELTPLEERADALQTQTIRAHEEAIKNFKSNNMPDSKRWGSIGIRSRWAARLFGESAKFEETSKIRGNRMLRVFFSQEAKKQSTLAEQINEGITKLKLMIGKK